MKDCPVAVRAKRKLKGTAMTEYETHDGIVFAVLWRESEQAKTLPCPFCGDRHTHGIGDGHRIPHCINPKEKVTASDGTVIFAKRGYIIRTLPKKKDGN